MKKCNECGEENELENKICQNCGAALADSKPQVKNQPLIIETPLSAHANQRKKKKDHHPTWNQSQWDKDPDYEQLPDKDARVENVELDLSGQEDDEDVSTEIKGNDLPSESENRQAEEITLQSPIQANSEELLCQSQEEPQTLEPMMEYTQDLPPLEDPSHEEQERKANLEAALKKNLEPTRKSKGIAYFDRNYIRFAGCVKLTPGQEICIDEQDYVLKPIERRKFPYIYAGIVALVILVLALLQITSVKKVKDSGQIIGMAYNQETRAQLPNVLVQIKELGQKVQSDKLGFFKLDLIPAGSYDLQVSLAGFQTATDFTVVNKKKDSYLLVGLKPEVKETLTAADNKTETGSAKSSETVPSQTKYGKIAVKTNVAGAIVLVDNKMVGKGNEIHAEIPTGLHTIRITSEGYQDWVKNIRVQAAKSLDLEVTLSEVERPKQVSAQDYVQAGDEASSQGNYEKALENYAKAIGTDLSNGRAYLARGLVYQKLGEPKRAKDDLTAAAKIFLDTRNYDQAVKCYDQLLQISPDDPDLLYYRGLCHMKTEQYEKSIEDLKRATQARSKFFWAYMQLSYAYYKAGKYEESIKSVEKARKINPHDKKIYVRLAEGYLALGNKSKTKENYDRFTELTTLVDREEMKGDPEWIKVLQALNVSDQAEF